MAQNGSAAIVISDDSPFLNRFREYLAVVMPGLAATAFAAPAFAIGPLSFAIRQDFPFSVAQVGFAFAAFYAASAFCVGVGGWIVTRWGSLPPLRVGLIVTAVVCIFTGFTDSALAVICVSALAGAVNGLVTPSANLMVMSLVPHRFHGLSFGMKVAGAFAAATFAAASVWATTTLGASWRAPFVAFATFAITVCLLSFTLRVPGRSVRPTSPPAARSFTPVQRVTPRGSLLLLVLGGLLATIGTSVLAPFLVEGLADHGIPLTTAGGLLALGSWLGIASRILVGGLSDRWGDATAHLRMVAVMNVFAAASLLTLGLATAATPLIVATVAGFTLGSAWPGLVQHAVIVTHRRAQARATSWMQGGTYSGAVVGPLLFGIVAERVSFASAWAMCAVIVVAGVIILSGGVALLRK
ncbi:MFS transporter [Microbacterium sp. zg-B185]|uniref:MFS transporter n=1 Tax=Microbacterium sp. zg-B185 TaxID=3049070 RepID=UPI00254AC1D5|nr:MFS transporter [Microbacterium sp. zg-B185]WIM19566.1 MFS transporter [Microbacterium sp. zg-B185]